MSIKSELSVLKVNIQNAKDKLYSNLVHKGVTDITTASTLTEMANSVSDIVTGTSSGGGNPFEAIGYEAIPKYILDDIDYSKTIYDNWDASITNCYNKFKGNKQLVYCPLVDTSNVTNMGNMFSGCTNLEYVPSIDASNVTNINKMFSHCSSLTELDLSSFDTSKVTNMSSLFYGCDKLTKVDGYISLKSIVSGISNSYLFGSSTQTTLRKITFKDIGYDSNFTKFDMSYVSNWGINTSSIPDAKQSLIDSLITYSFDRASVGYNACTVNLLYSTEGVLTEDEIAQITAKGFTIA